MTIIVFTQTSFIHMDFNEIQKHIIYTSFKHKLTGTYKLVFSNIQNLKITNI